MEVAKVLEMKEELRQKILNNIMQFEQITQVSIIGVKLAHGTGLSGKLTTVGLTIKTVL
jgi:hypothetical protein